MNTFDETEPAEEKLPPQQEKLLFPLTVRLNGRPPHVPMAARAERSVLEIPTVSVGEVLCSFSADDDLLGEMLDGRAWIHC